MVEILNAHNKQVSHCHCHERAVRGVLSRLLLSARAFCEGRYLCYARRCSVAGVEVAGDKENGKTNEEIREERPEDKDASIKDTRPPPLHRAGM